MPVFVRGGFSRNNILSKGGYSAVGVNVVGAEDVQAAFEYLARRGSKKAALAGMRTGAQVETKHIKRVHKQRVGEKTGTLYKSIAWRIRKTKGTHLSEAVAGYNVGATVKGVKKTAKGTLKSTNVLAPHAHLIALGTLKRYRKKIGGKFKDLEENGVEEERRRTGKGPRITVVPVAYAQSRSEAYSKIVQRIRKVLDDEERRRRRRGK